MKIVEYAKEHPWMTGIVVVIGGIIFLSITGVFGGGSSSGGGGGSDRPSDAEVTANAAIQAAQIQATAATTAAQIGAGQQMNSDNLAAQVAIRQVEAGEAVNLAYIGAQKEIGLKTIDGQTQAVVATVQGKQAQYDSILSRLPSLKKKDRDDVLKSLITGEYGYQGGPNYGNSAAGIIGSLGNFVGNVGNVIPFL